VGEWESPRAGDGRVGEWGSGRWGIGGLGEWEMWMENLPSSFFLLPSSFYFFIE